MSKNKVPQGIHKQEQSPIISQGVEEQPQLAHFDDPCHELLHEVSISQGSSSNKALNLLKKGLLVWGEAMEASKRRRSMIDYIIQQLSKGSSEGSGIIPEVPMSQRTILVAQEAHFLDLIMKFKTSPMMRKTKLRKQS
ncbi:hypothetical protein Tco_0666832 [Tanacetum coccineum]